MLCPLSCGATALLVDVECLQWNSTSLAALNSPFVSEDKMDQPWPSRSFLDLAKYGSGGSKCSAVLNGSVRG